MGSRAETSQAPTIEKSGISMILAEIILDKDYSQMTPRDRLAYLVRLDSSFLENGSLLRVDKMLEHEENRPNSPHPWQRIFTDIADYQLYYLIRAEWHNLTRSELQRGAGGILASTFYTCFNRWMKEHGLSAEVRESLREDLLPRKSRYDRFKLRGHRNSLTDWIDEFNSHPEWHGMSAKQMYTNQDNGAAAWYASFMKWTKSVTESESQRHQLILNIFPNWHNGAIKRTNFQSINDWADEYLAHPEWLAMTRSELKNDYSKGGQAFLLSLRRWVNGQTSDPGKRAELLDAVLPKRERRDLLTIKSIEEWIEIYIQHPEWEHRGSESLKNDSNGGSQFYYGLRDWLQNNIADPNLRREYWQLFFTRVRRGTYQHLITLDHWVKEFSKHNEWVGHSATEMQFHIDADARIFYKSFQNWLQKNIPNLQRRKELRQLIYRSERAPFRFIFNKHSVSFDSNQERVIAVLLNRFGLVDFFEEGKNLHVRINSDRQHTADFVINGVVLEFHPLSILEITKGSSLIDYYTGRIRLLESSPFSGHRFIHIWKIDQLLVVLRELGLTVEDAAFKLAIKQAYKDTADYDIKQKLLKVLARHPSQTSMQN